MTKSRTSPSGADFDHEELLALTRLDLDQGRVEEGLRKLKQVLAAEDAPADTYSMAARVYAQLGLFERAKGLFARYLELKPGAMVETFQLGMAHFDAGQAEEALEIWGELLKEHPTHPPALFYSALARAQQGRPADARQALDVLLKSAPADNLYFSRAKELLQGLDAGQRPMALEAVKAGTKATAAAAKDLYKTEH